MKMVDFNERNLKNLPSEIEFFYEQCKNMCEKLKNLSSNEKVPKALRIEAENYDTEIYALIPFMHDFLLEFSNNTTYTVGRRPIGSLKYIEEHEIKALSPRRAKKTISDKFPEVNPIEFEVIGMKFSWEE